MRSTRARLKLCLRWCKSHEHQLRAQSLADKLAAGDSFDFWSGVRSINPGSHTLPLRVDHAVGDEGIASMWGDHFKGILNCVRDEESIGCHIHDGCINSLSYADDMVLLAPTADALQDLINVCQVYAAKHDIVYNTTKTECMTTKLLVVGNTLQRKFSYCSREVKMELFRRHCYSIYCNTLWSRFKVATLNRLKVCHNDILKRRLGLLRWCSSSLAFARNGVNNLDVIRRHSVFSLRSRVELSANSIITSVRQSSAYVCGPIQQRWLGLLFVQNVG
ncbi:hypothetical protein GWK47_003866 [Chionoecetes opilio]|uniref:Reverse transcriptase domain-containing protein n=1 Tax=Chionoecetes opilio TaxID=41210 RepID=A0A8J5D422_CHIOP|nr:hypothetical protein GWK47_003866 [Chionoecetes opilio]